MEDQLFLRFMVPLEGGDDLLHPRAMIRASADQGSLVHPLHAHAVLLKNQPGTRNLGDRITIPAAHRPAHTGRLGCLNTGTVRDPAHPAFYPTHVPRKPVPQQFPANVWVVHEW